jgi:nucleotide-binding universal stress UspA family protein
MLSTILVPLDGSALAEHALPFAERLARVAKGHVILVRVIPAQSAETSIESSLAHTGRDNLEELASRLRQAETSVDVAVPEGDPASQIVATAAAQGADLIIMSTHVRSGLGRWRYGSVADAVIRTASVPVMLIPSEMSAQWPTDRRPRLLVPLDESHLSEAVLGPVMELATRLNAEVVLTEVVTWPPLVYSDPVELMAGDIDAQVAAARRYLADVTTRLRQSGFSVRCLTGVGRTAAETIVRLARDEHADLIAMATHGRGGLARVVLGSTTTGTLQHARLPLLIVRPTDLQPAEPTVHESHSSLVNA